MELREKLALIEVEYQNDNKKAVLTFLDEENGQVLEVNFNKQAYDTVAKQFVDDAEKASKVDDWCYTYFDTTFDKLNQAVGQKKDVYKYDSFNSLWESDYAQKFDDEDVGKVFTATIKNIKDDGIAIVIEYEIDNILYSSKMTYAKYVENLKKWFEDPIRKEKQFEKFKNKFGVPVEDADQILEKEIMVEVKKAFGKFIYGDIKKPSWK